MGRLSVRGPQQSKQKNTDAVLFDRWVSDYASDLYRFAFRLCGENSAAEDLVQETLHEAWKHRGPLCGIREPHAWMFLILRRRHMKLRRVQQRRPWTAPPHALRR